MGLLSENEIDCLVHRLESGCLEEVLDLYPAALVQQQVEAIQKFITKQKMLPPPMSSLDREIFDDCVSGSTYFASIEFPDWAVDFENKISIHIGRKVRFPRW